MSHTSSLSCTSWSSDSTDPIVVVVTGSSGFFGRHLIRELREEASSLGVELHLCLYDRVQPTEGDENIAGDILDTDALTAAFQGAHVVIHAASVVDWGTVTESQLRAVNVDGTRNVVSACVSANVGTLIYTSSLDVLFSRGVPLSDADETTPYPTTPLNAYCATKAQAERVTLASDGTPQPNGGTLRALVLRPSGMYGEADPFLFPPMLNFVASKGLTPKIRIGGHTPSCQHAYVGNVAHAHAYVALRAAMNQTVRSSVGGNIFFIVDQAPSNVFDLLAPVVRKMGLEPPTTRLPDIVARTVGTITDALTTLVSPVWSVRPKFTYSAVDMILTPRSVNGDKLKRETGWRPKYSEEEAAERTAKWFKSNPDFWA